jgi:hypothetical protein
MKYKINISEGCTSGGCVEVNDSLYSCEDKRYELSLDQREQFHNDLCDELKKLLREQEIAVQDLIKLLPEVRRHYSPTCDQCGDEMITTYYKFKT